MRLTLTNQLTRSYSSAKKVNKSNVSIRRLTFQNVGPFRGQHELTFSSKLNLITGWNGSGLTTLYLVLKSTLGLPFEKHEADYFSARQRKLVSSLTAATAFCADVDGTAPNDRRWEALVALDGESVFHEHVLRELFAAVVEKGVDELRFRFDAFVSEYRKKNLSVADQITCHLFRSGKVEFSVNGLTNQSLSASLWTSAGAGDRALTAYGLFFLLRQSIQHSGPLILNEPFQRLDISHREQLAKLITALPNQIILIERPTSLTVTPIFSGHSCHLLSYKRADNSSQIELLEDVSLLTPTEN